MAKKEKFSDLPENIRKLARRRARAASKAYCGSYNANYISMYYQGWLGCRKFITDKIIEVMKTTSPNRKVVEWLPVGDNFEWSHEGCTLIRYKLGGDEAYSYYTEKDCPYGSNILMDMKAEYVTIK